MSTTGSMPLATLHVIAPQHIINDALTSRHVPSTDLSLNDAGDRTSMSFQSPSTLQIRPADRARTRGRRRRRWSPSLSHYRPACVGRGPRSAALQYRLQTDRCKRRGAGGTQDGGRRAQTVPF